MKTLKLVVELTYDDDIAHGNDPESIAWFYEHVIGDQKGLILHSNEIGDEVGSVIVLEVL